jgi:hypothetical protein
MTLSVAVALFSMGCVVDITSSSVINCLHYYSKIILKGVIVKKTLWIVGLCLILTAGLEAKVLDVAYKVSFGMFGEMGISKAHLETKGNHYTISINGKASGLAKALSGNRKEYHTSKGYVRNGIYYSQMYSVNVEYGEKRKEIIYTIDYNTKKVTKVKKKYKQGKLTSENSETLDFFCTNDLLTLYFNIGKLIKDKNQAGLYKFKAVGAEGQKGKVELIVPTKKQLPKYKKTLGKGNFWYLTAIIHQKIFSSNKGELMLAIGEDGVTQKAVLKDLVMFGDLVAKRVK